MEITDIKIGIKFKFEWQSENDAPNRIYGLTETRVLYTDGKITSRGGTNRKQSTWWKTKKGFINDVESGKITIITE